MQFRFRDAFAMRWLLPWAAAVAPGLACSADPTVASDEAEQAEQVAPATATNPRVVPAPTGCAMAHCDPRMSDHADAFAPRGPTPAIQWHDTTAPGSRTGLGCASNGQIAACTYTGNAGDNLVVYDASGNRLWTSTTTLDGTAWTSAPLISRDGSIIAADDRVVVRFAPDGAILWQTPTPGGRPISPVVTESGAIVLATQGGPISAYRGSDGALIGSLVVRSDPADPEFFETVNTPSVRGDRIYVVTQRTHDPAKTGWLVAIDIAERAASPISLAWHFEFGGPSGGSPLRIGRTIYFDGGSLHPGDPAAPVVFGVRDDGRAPAQRFAVPVAGPIQASPSQDPRGGFWVFPTGGLPVLLHLDQADGHEIEELDVDALVDEPGTHQPSSPMTMTGSRDRPVMIVAATALQTTGASFVTAIDLADRSLRWKVELAASRDIDWTAAQFPIVHAADGAPRVVVPGLFSGAYGIGD